MNKQGRDEQTLTTAGTPDRLAKLGPVRDDAPQPDAKNITNFDPDRPDRAKFETPKPQTPPPAEIDPMQIPALQLAHMIATDTHMFQKHQMEAITERLAKELCTLATIHGTAALRLQAIEYTLSAMNGGKQAPWASNPGPAEVVQ